MVCIASAVHLSLLIGIRGHDMINIKKPHLYAFSGVVFLGVIYGVFSPSGSQASSAAKQETPPAVLTVALTPAQTTQLQRKVPTSGHISAWQEASIGAEIEGLRIKEIYQHVGDTVQAGQVLARLNSDMVQAELAEAQAAVKQAEAQEQEALADLARAEALIKSGAMSKQQLSQYNAAAAVSSARLEAMRSAAEKQQVRLSHTQIIAPSAGVISARTAAVGAVVSNGSELFRLITDGRLEWRALVAPADLAQLAVGQSVQIILSDTAIMHGTIRIIAPTIDTTNHYGLIYVDLPAAHQLKAGAFVRGYIETNINAVITVPRRAVILRDGFHYVMQVNEVNQVMMRKVTTGSVVEEQIEITAGLQAGELVIAAGLSFLNEGDNVNVLQHPIKVADQDYPTEKAVSLVDLGAAQ